MRGHTYVALALALLGIAGCSAMDEAALGDSGPETSSGGGSTIPTETAQNDPLDDKVGAEYPAPGTLTAGDWDDNLNWEWFKTYRRNFLDVAPASFPAKPVEDRVVIRVSNDLDEPISNAMVTIRDQNATEIFSAPTASDGRVLYFPQMDSPASSGMLNVEVTHHTDVALGEVLPAPVASPTWELKLPAATREAPSALDLAFVIDASGSMGDELAYLKGEIFGIITAISQNVGLADAQYAVIVYRDRDQDYLTREFDFNTDLVALETFLDEQSALGGGDFPEAVDAGVVEMNQLSWRPGNVARVAFLVADAGTQDNRGMDLLGAAAAARLQGIRLYTVAASGADDAAEYYLRQSAQLTLGRYLFLTDDSGVGDGHGEPHIPCYVVQFLNTLMIRMVNSELNGTREPAAQDDILRTVGNPDQNGVCILTDGTEVGF